MPVPKGYRQTDEHRRKISEAMSGRKHSEESRRKRSETMKRFWADVRALREGEEAGGGNG